MRHSELPPVLDVIVVDGYEIAIHYAGTWADLCRNYVRSLPQNSATKQGGNRAIAEDCTRRPSVVGAGHVGGVGDVLCGSEAK